MADININANEIDKTDNFDVIPAGDYKAVVIDSTLEQTKNKDGDYFKFKFQIIEGQYKDRLVWHNCTRQNKNAQAIAIGQKQLAQIMDACGKPVAKRTEDLHNIPLIISLVVKTSEQYGAQNEIKKFRSVFGAAPVAAAQTAAATATPPWMKKNEFNDEIPF